jgi:hypothetical protein
MIIGQDQGNSMMKLNIIKAISLNQSQLKNQKIVAIATHQNKLNFKELQLIMPNLAQRKQITLLPLKTIITSAGKYHFKAKQPTIQNSNLIKFRQILHGAMDAKIVEMGADVNMSLREEEDFKDKATIKQ